MAKETMCEIVKCKCGATIAACVMGYQSAEWHRDLRKYLKLGYEVSHVPSSETTLGNCDCNKKQLELQFQ